MLVASTKGLGKLAHWLFEGRMKWPKETTLIRGIVAVEGSRSLSGPRDSPSHQTRLTGQLWFPSKLNGYLLIAYCITSCYHRCTYSLCAFVKPSLQRVLF